jgi:hypothetical protein
MARWQPCKRRARPEGEIILSTIMQTAPPPRLFVIFAAEASEAVIFRRGPAQWYHVIRWNTARDEFYPGAWIRGRIYPECCDLSPNGELLLYFIHQGRRLGTSYTHAYNAISRAPWLEALGLWSQGTTYGGGGRFTDNRSATLRCSPVEAHPEHPGSGLKISFDGLGSRLPDHASTGEVEDAPWSGRDQAGRLVYVQNGKLVSKSGPSISDDLCLADFNSYSPDPQPAPEWARRPLIVPHQRFRKSRTPKRTIP